MPLTGFTTNMKIEEILKPYKYFSVARHEDNQDLLNFFSTMTMDTNSFSLRYDRGTDFFKFTNNQAEKFIIFIIKDESGLIKGCASIAFIPHILNGKKVLCAYLGDLRISALLSAKIRITWKKCYSEIIQHFSKIEEFFGVHFLYSAILEENQNAMRSLLKNNDQIIYHLLSHYTTFNVIKPMPSAYFNSNRFTITKADIITIKKFLIANNQDIGLENDFESEIKRRITSWDDFNEQSFSVVKDHEEIVAVFAPWTSPAKKLVIEKMSPFQKVMSFFFPLLGLNPLKEKKPINVLYLTHLVFSSQRSSKDIKKIMNAILLSLFSERKDFHVISFFTYPEWEIDSLPFFMEKTKANFYQVMSKKQFEENDFIDLKNNPPAFEIGIA